MLKNNQTDWYSNKSYQRFLADNLIKSLGHDNAIKACYDYKWLETLVSVESGKSNLVHH